MIKEILENLKSNNRLTNRVLDYYIDESDNYNADDMLQRMEELQKYGCVSGMINELIYYDDTTKFFDEYVDEINDTLSEVMENTGCSMEELFGDKFDKSDPLITGCYNKNLLAWFVFEETSYQLYNQIYDKLKNNVYGGDYSHE